MAWSDIPESQTPDWGALSPSSNPLWGGIPDAQTPGWGGTPYDVFTAFQFGAFQLPGFQIGSPVSNIWGAINTYELPDWASLP